MENLKNRGDWDDLDFDLTKVNNAKPLREVFVEYAKHWKWFILSIAVCLFIAALKILTTEKEYETSSSVVINEDKNGGGSSASGATLSLDDMGLLSSTSNIDNEIVIFTSPDLMRMVVDSLNLTSRYYLRDKLRKQEVYENTPVAVSYSHRFENFRGQFDLNISKEDGKVIVSGTYKPSKDETVEISNTLNSLPAKIILPKNYGWLSIEPTAYPFEEGTDYTVQILNQDNAADVLTDGLKVTQTTKNSSALQITLSVNNLAKGADVLKQLVRQYNLQNNLYNNQISYNTALFINERLKEISKELSDVERDVVDYRQKNKIVDIKVESALSVQQNSENQQKLMDAETQLSIIDLVDKFVKNPDNQLKVVPNLGITDPSLAAIINDYNVKILSSESLIKNTGAENPSRVKALEELQTMHVNIVNSLRSVRRSFQIARDDLQRLAGNTNSQIQELPQQEKGLMERARQQQIKENLFLFLMQKREETNISIAAISEKARTVISPKASGIQKAPQTKQIMLAAFLLGLIIPILVLWVSERLRTKISGREELARLTPISIVGQISKAEEVLIVHEHPNSTTSELFRAFRNNLNFIFHNKPHKVTMITSSVSGEGKTFVSLNLAFSYALSGKKVLLIGGDIRKPKLKQILGLSESKGLSDYLAQETKPWAEYVNHQVMRPNLDVLVSGTIPPNPNELLMSPSLEMFLAEAKEKYDMVIIDTAPVGMVSDSFLFAPYVDAVVYVVREKTSLKESVEFINSIYKEKRFENMYIALNDSDVTSRYGYRYGYGKGYGYNNVATTK